MPHNDWPFTGFERHAYQMIMADPPWVFETYSENGKGKSAELHYDCMSLQDIKDLPVQDLADPDGCLLWLWCTAPMFPKQLEVVEAWGFKYATQGVWVKMGKNGQPVMSTGYSLRNAHEPFIIARRGKPKIASHSVRSVVFGPRREHSRKPDEAYAAAELLIGPEARKADLFSRETRAGWEMYGDETGKFDVPGKDELECCA